MDILLDEQVPELVLEPLRALLPGHRVDHVQTIRWKGKQDVHLIPDMKRRGYARLSLPTPTSWCGMTNAVRSKRLAYTTSGSTVPGAAPR